MAGDFMSEAEAKDRGLNKHFNSYTLRGRFNWVALTYGTMFGIFAFYKIRKWLNPPPEKPTGSTGGNQSGASYYSHSRPRKNDTDRDCRCW